MHKNIPPILLIAALLGGAPLLAAAQDAAGGPTTREVVESRLIDLKDRLNLDDYQWNQVEMILKSSIRERVAIARRYGLDGDPAAFEALEGKQKRAMKRALKDSRKNTARRMKRYLDKDQYKEFKRVQEEIHDNFLAQVDAD